MKAAIDFVLEGSTDYAELGSLIRDVRQVGAYSVSVNFMNMPWPEVTVQFHHLKLPSILTVLADYGFDAENITFTDDHGLYVEV